LELRIMLPLSTNTGGSTFQVSNVHTKSEGNEPLFAGGREGPLVRLITAYKVSSIGGPQIVWFSGTQKTTNSRKGKVEQSVRGLKRVTPIFRCLLGRRLEGGSRVNSQNAVPEKESRGKEPGKITIWKGKGTRSAL